MYSRVACGIDRERHDVIGFRDSTPELAGFVWQYGLAQGLTVYVTYKTSHKPHAHLHNITTHPKYISRVKS